MINFLEINNKNFSIQKYSLVARKAFFNLARIWQIEPQKQMILLGIESKEEFKKLLNNTTEIVLSEQILERISYLLGIYKALQILLPDKKSANTWINKANMAPIFKGKSALEFMLSGKIEDLHLVRKYLDSERGG